ncbi:MAG TPA: CapA family protein [Stellaceae bacterium]|nr:CapA family protein [Stellaceae bacterium]
MATQMIAVGDVNLMNVAAGEEPFALMRGALAAAAIRFGNLECCLYDPPDGRAVEHEGFFADPEIAGRALKAADFDALGLANNVNYGEAAIEGSIARLAALGIAHTGAGPHARAAHAPALVERDGLTFGFLQRSSVYWPTNHEAGESSTGIAVIRAHTAYQVPMHKTRPEIPPLNRPGIPPEILTWADPLYLRRFRDDVARLREAADIVVASCHWGLFREVLHYMREIAHAAIEAGADVVVGHGPHYALPIEAYRGKPIFYGLGSFSFHTGHGGRRHGDWLGMMASLSWEGRQLRDAAFRFVRHDAQNRTVLCPLAAEGPACDEIAKTSAAFGTRLLPRGEEVAIALPG